MSRVVVHYDERGEVSYFVEGNTKLLIVDERAPSDRIYQFSGYCSAEEIDEILGDDKVGTRFDGSNAAKKLGQTGYN